MKTMQVEIEIPDWVKWMAVDADGRCYGYKETPIFNIGIGLWNRGGMSILLYQGKKPKNFTKELYEVV